MTPAVKILVLDLRQRFQHSGRTDSHQESEKGRVLFNILSKAIHYTGVI